jgi:hypothetical protein
MVKVAEGGMNEPPHTEQIATNLSIAVGSAHD